jgi:hypothetical protein
MMLLITSMINPPMTTPRSNALVVERNCFDPSGIDYVNMAGADGAEVAPAYDHADITALAAAHIASDPVCLYRHGAKRTALR